MCTHGALRLPRPTLASNDLAPTPAWTASHSPRHTDAIESDKPFTLPVAGERLRIPAQATFNIEHERGDGQQELEFQWLWRSGAR
jgi:hypothetical protein